MMYYVVSNRPATRNWFKAPGTHIIWHYMLNGAPLPDGWTDRDDALYHVQTLADQIVTRDDLVAIIAAAKARAALEDV